MKVLDIYLVDMKQIKFGVNEKEYNAACKIHDLENLPAVQAELAKLKVDDGWIDICERTSRMMDQSE